MGSSDRGQGEAQPMAALEMAALEMAAPGAGYPSAAVSACVSLWL